MKRVLVTGQIASGKSEVCRYIASKGYPVYDSDSRTKALYESVPGLKERLVNEIGEDFGEIFTDAVKRERLEDIVYPLVRRDFDEFCKGKDLVFFESAIALGKKQFADAFDAVIAVTAPLELRLSRNPKVAQRDSVQHPVENADWHIDNSGSVEQLHIITDNILKQLI